MTGDSDFSDIEVKKLVILTQVEFGEILLNTLLNIHWEDYNL